MNDKDRNQISRPHWYSIGLPDPIQTTVWISVIIVCILSILDLAGWIFNLPSLKSIMPRWIPMNIISAICFISTAAALVIIRLKLPAILRKIITGMLAIFIILVSLSTICIYLYSALTGNEAVSTEIPFLTFLTGHGSKMAFSVALNFFILGCIVLLLLADNTKTAGLTHVLIIPIALSSYFVPASYILDIYSLTELTHVPVSLNSGLAFCGLCTAVLLINPDTWLLKIFTARETGGIVARRLLLPLMVLPVVIAWLVLYGERAGIFEYDEGVVLVTVTYTACFLALVWLTARFVSKIDEKRYTSEQALQSTKNYLENLINYANAPIIVWNPDTRIQLFNHAFEHLTGYSSSEVEGKKLDMLFPVDSLEESNTKIIDALTENWKTIEIPILTKKKDIRIVLWNSANIFDTDRKTVLSTIAQGNDITERINAEQKVKERTKDLEVANLQLKKELTERYLAQEALRKNEAQLKELNATKDKFFNIIAHDLKNPFTSLIGSSELLFRNIDKMDNEKIKTLALILNDASKSGYAILLNLLDWSRSQTGLLKFNPENINLKDLVDEHILNLEQISSNKEIKIFSEIRNDLFIYGDKNMIKTVLRNLLSNAVKYSHRSDKVIVCASVYDKEVIITVKDNGIGIPEEDIKNIFRIDAKYSVPGTENEQGTGLGLKLCKEFVEKQGGEIWVESTEHKGSEFKFSIPVKKG
ncbi:MAG: PAS domain-containing sensor histidine kinase [Bacteroidia bacterium]|nr:PAS domain-containing sensor histidine kinase [Bacteroidia bacterium]